MPSEVYQNDLGFSSTWWKNSDGHISTRGHPIHFMFVSRVGFLGSVDQMALFPV